MERSHDQGTDSMSARSRGPPIPPPAALETQSTSSGSLDDWLWKKYPDEEAIAPSRSYGRVYPPPRSTSSEPAANGRQDSTSDSHADGSSHGRHSFSTTLAPLQVEKYSSLYGSGAPPPLSSESEKLVAARIHELSQLRSPLLRELAKRLGDVFHINTPKYVEEKEDAKFHTYSHLEVKDRWRDIQGAFGWAGLLEPIDPVLRAEIVRYGEFAQATYDAFDSAPTSKYCGSSKYSKAELFEKVGLQRRGYEITHFLYATSELPLPKLFSRSSSDDPWSKDSNWIGFVAVCTAPDEIARLGRRDIVITWRGTMSTFEWIEDLRDYMEPAGFDPRHESGTEHVMVEAGFLSVYRSSNSNSRYNKTSARQQVLEAVRELVGKYSSDPFPLSISVTGHSLGSALATLCAYDIAESGMNSLQQCPKVPTNWYDEDHASQISRSYQLSLWNTDGRQLERAQPKARRRSVFKNLKALLEDTVGDVREKLGWNWDLDPQEYQAAAPVAAANAGAGERVSKFSPDKIPITVYSFAGPKVGNAAFANRSEKLGVAVLRIVNVRDVVPKVPGLEIFAKTLKVIQPFVPSVPSYKHVGVELIIDNYKSPYLRETKNWRITHDLEGYLHLVDGYHGFNLPFEKTLRCIALANKKQDFLKPEYFIPPMWWQEENKGMIRDENGEWILPTRAIELFPPSPISEAENIHDRDFRQFLRSVSIALETSESEPIEDGSP
ncbi:phospholipase A1 [Marchantia polymorpha subsp. ruderalis]|uniref:Fungal lipase-type domain-containing protein n=2 Tax=Marchantia polymorpha TaxID=3197 RepID=A0AAF6B8L6_MARPO|nr:hypothetical protein MARPO_0011s0072 [Marchantia polymorpha]BBN08350.1 hypothetical protein Mp_4g10860 [Marchantia polymorpha subsp. ruderalis]|eukprot:PTQ46386.1 hypothetical protein MARPO_0011s0072 [Marchantia polymorpha]